MWNDLRQESPLVGLKRAFDSKASAEPYPFRMVERPFLDLATLRGDGGDPTFREVLREAVGVERPSVPNTVAEGDKHVIMWLGPDEWMLQWTYEAMAGGESSALLHDSEHLTRLLLRYRQLKKPAPEPLLT